MQLRKKPKQLGTKLECGYHLYSSPHSPKTQKMNAAYIRWRSLNILDYLSIFYLNYHGYKQNTWIYSEERRARCFYNRSHFLDHKLFKIINFKLLSSCKEKVTNLEEQCSWNCLREALKLYKVLFRGHCATRFLLHRCYTLETYQMDAITSLHK